MRAKRISNIFLITFMVVLVLVLTGAKAPANAKKSASVIDNDTSKETFKLFSDVGHNIMRLQTFTITGTKIPKIDLWTYKVNPSDDLFVQIYAIDGSDNPTGKALATVKIPASSVPKAAGWVTVKTNLKGLKSGGKYGYVFSSPKSPRDVYGFGYNDDNLYKKGVERFSEDSGKKWKTETNRSLKFITYK